MRPTQLSTVLNIEFKGANEGHHTPVMLWGAPGVGKSQMILQIGKQNDVPVIDIRLSQMEPSDLRGIPFKNGARVEWAVPSLLPHKDLHGDKGILFLDEITSAAPSVSAAAYQLILDRKLGEYEIPDGWAIFAAGNRQGDRGVTYTMPAPLANRFSHYEVDINLDDWVKWAFDDGIDDRVIGFLRFRPDQLFDFDPVHNPVAFPTPRSWEFCHRALYKFMDQPDLLSGALQACVGPAAGIELHAYISSLEQLPDIDAILNGSESSVPEEIDLQYAVAAALIARAIKARGTETESAILGHILNYANNFRQREMGVMLVSDLHRVMGLELFAIPEFATWAEQIADILLYD